MNIITINLANAVILMGVGLLGYLDVLSPTALIPVGFGFLLLICSVLLKYKPGISLIVGHVAVSLTLLIFIALVGMRLPKSLDSGGLGLVRVLIMIFSSGFSLIAFVKHFIDNKKSPKY